MSDVARITITTGTAAAISIMGITTTCPPAGSGVRD
jgi:hypothetical protein